MKNIKLGLVGAGRISRRHVEAIAANKGIELSMICDSIEERAQKLADELKIPYTTDMKEMQGLDVITIATPSGAHPDHVINVIKNTDARKIICEKPLSLTIRELVAMYEVAKKYKKTILPVYQNRYNPLVQFIKKLIDSNELGTIYQFSVNIFWNRNEEYYKNNWHGTLDLDGGVLYTQASHYVDMLLHFFGKIKEAKGLGGRLRGLEVQDTISSVISFENGVVGSLNTTASTYRKNYRTEATIIAQKGTIRLSGTNLNTIEFWDVENLEKPDMDFTIDHIYGKGHDTLYEYLVNEKFDMFPTYEEVRSGIELMEKLSF